jgi:catechol 2,3-dioxygenase-like lactoylglutathione lyase family enzyme
VVDVPRLDGVHHLKLPVSDLHRSLAWYRTRLGYRKATEFVEQGVLVGCVLRHPRGGPMLGLRLDPPRAAASAGFDYFAIGVPDRAALDDLAARLTELGETHAGVHQATMGWILPHLHDPDGHEVRFYTTAHHTDPEPEADPEPETDPEPEADLAAEPIRAGDPPETATAAAAPAGRSPA